MASSGKGYKINIKSEKEEIKFTTDGDKPQISTIEYARKTIVDSVTSRSSAIVYEFHIYGSINPETKQETQKLAKWSTDTENSKIYREITLEIFEDANCKNPLRTYGFDKMYIMDYAEKFCEDEADAGIFQLVLRQRDEKATQNITAI